MKTTASVHTQAPQRVCLRLFPLAVLLLALCHTLAASIVGYVNVVIPANGYAFVANPLDNPPNVLTNLVPNPPVGSRAYFWDVTNQTFLPRATKSVLGWDLNYALPVGAGVVLYSPVTYTNTFVGNLYMNTTYTNFVAGSNRFTLLGCKVPVGGPLSVNTNGPGFPRIDGASAHFFRETNQAFADGYTCFTNYGWFDPKGVESTNGPTLLVAQSIFVQNPGPATNWIRIFTNDVTLGPVIYRPSLAGSGGSELPVQSLSVRSGKATIKILNPGGAAFDVWFSTDGASWTKVAANQSGKTWAGPLPDPVQGQFLITTTQTGGSAK